MAEKRTPFASVYNRFLEKVTDDMYIEFTVQDTIKDLQNLLVDAIPGFEFPRKNLYDYEIKTEIIREDAVLPSDFVIGVIWNELPEDNEIQIPDVIVERSSFAANLTLEESNKAYNLIWNPEFKVFASVKIPGKSEKINKKIPINSS